MKIFLFFFTILTVSLASNDIEQKWNEFKIVHKKLYGSSIEEQKRYLIFSKNVKKIEEHNEKYDKGLSTYKMGINHLADLTAEEFMNRYGINTNFYQGKRFNKSNKKISKSFKELDSIDWREKGAITPVLDQGECNSCYSFSSVSVVEAQHFITNNNLVPLSVQEVIDCSQEYGSAGCGGGFMESTYHYIRDYGIMSSKDYPFTGHETGECLHNQSKIITQVHDYFDIAPEHEEELTRVVTEVGPATLAFDVTDSFQFYKSGIFHDDKCNPYHLNHCVAAVGYGIENGTKYWTLRNSWGPTWGENGYFRLERDVNACGLAMWASYATVRKYK